MKKTSLQGLQISLVWEGFVPYDYLYFQTDKHVDVNINIFVTDIAQLK